jgi:hypothetical protein
MVRAHNDSRHGGTMREGESLSGVPRRKCAQMI